MRDAPYIVITADTHAGASIDAYRDYLDPEYRQDFDAWRGSYKKPAKSHVGSKKSKNWDSPYRHSMTPRFISRRLPHRSATNTNSPAAARTTAGWPTFVRSSQRAAPGSD
jgi:hypothetical protein